MKTAKDCEGCEAYMRLTGLAALNHRNKLLAEEFIKVILEFRDTDAPLVDNIVAAIRARVDYVFDAPVAKAG